MSWIPSKTGERGCEKAGARATALQFIARESNESGLGIAAISNCRRSRSDMFMRRLPDRSEAGHRSQFEINRAADLASLRMAKESLNFFLMGLR
jgi:hypothetical protein